MCTLAVHWGWLDTVPGFPDRLLENPPRQASSNTPNTSPSAPTCPPRGRTSSTSPTTPAGASRRSSASPGTKSTWPAASSGSRPCARRPWWGGFSPSHNPSPRRGVVARIVTSPHDANRQDPHRPMRYDTGRPRAVIRFRISQPRTASLPCPAGLRARRPSPMMDL